MSKDTAAYDLAVLKAASLVKASRQRAELLARIESSIARVTISRAASSALEEIEQTHLLIPRLSSVGPDTMVTPQADLKQTIRRTLEAVAMSYPPEANITCFNVDKASEAILALLAGEVSDDE